MNLFPLIINNRMVYQSLSVSERYHKVVFELLHYGALSLYSGGLGSI